MRKIYTFVMYLLVPVVLLRLLWKGRRSPAYRHRISERFSLRKLAPADVWVHAVSMGEVVAVTPLVECLLAQNLRVLMTTMTPTGSQQILTRFKSKVAHQYIPYDLPQCFRRFFKQVKPKIGIIMETELWPNMVYEAQSAGVPMVLANARLSDKAYVQYHRLRWFFAPMLAKFSLIGTQSVLDSHRYQALGAPSSKIMMLGNMKFDLSYPQSNQSDLDGLQTAWGLHRPVWIAASTHEDEEAQLLAQFSRIKQAIPEILLVFAPRRPERFQAVYAMVQQQGWNTGLRSQMHTLQPDNDVVVLDSMGELLQCYRLSDYVFVGGSLVPIGGHNVLEPIAMQVPVFCGPFMQNSKSVCDELVKHQALQICTSAEDIADKLIALYQNPAKRAQQIEHASAVLRTNSGAVARYSGKIEELLQG
ncbi:MAG: 3-deoxy-D-manno-octulosonic acid transferase [Gammaproteobacteria bacterium]|jgi:3-deoxy-D-manno-octulosonic-acid transferase|nr:3-deoxy-D-manno-octulosonic acid transferase [Gammaproteobacteria bacterium]